MHKRATSWLVAAIGAACVASIAQASRLPDEQVFRTVVVGCDVVVVGSVESTDEIGEGDAPECVSQVVVEEAITGDVSIGDTLDVWWRAMKWRTESGQIVELPEYAPRLDDVTGIRALYLLRIRTGGRLWTAGGSQPLVLSADNAVVLQEKLDLILDPPEVDMLERVLETPKLHEAWIGPNKVDVVGRLDRVAERLQRYLHVLEDDEGDKGGRSN